MANEKRLIDANALYSEIEDEYDLYYGEIVTNPRRFAEMVEDAPTVDAVEVVRCKDCKYWIEGRHHTGRCNALIQFHDAERYVVDEGHFCSYGERRTNDG